MQTHAVHSIARLNPLVDVVDMLRDIYPDMTLNSVQVLLLVATNPGISQREIMERTGLADSSASRIVGLLSEYGNRGTGPFYLIDLVPNKDDRRYKGLYLSKKGQALTTKMLAALKK